jgi:hypothetical protein
MTLDVHMFNTLLGPHFGVRSRRNADGLWPNQELKEWKARVSEPDTLWGNVSDTTGRNWPVRRGGGCVTSVYAQALKGKEAQ